MNMLKNELMLLLIKRMPAVPLSEICEKIRPHLQAYNLQLTQEGISFPPKISIPQFYEMRSNCGELYDSGIPFKSIVAVEELQNGISIFLRTGHVFTFISGAAIWRVTDVYYTPAHVPKQAPEPNNIPKI